MFRLATTDTLPPVPKSPLCKESSSNVDVSFIKTDTNPVMAESSARDVVIQALSVGDLSPADVPATHNNSSALGEEEVKQLGEQQDYARDQAPQDLQNGGPVRPVEETTSSVRYFQKKN